MASSKNPCVLIAWSTFLLAALTTSTLAMDVRLDCQPGWNLIGFHCYQFFSTPLPWDSANRVCRSYGSQLVKVKDFYENDDIGKFVEGRGSTTYWTGATRLGAPPTNSRYLKWSDDTEVSMSVGYWQNDQPIFEDGQCVMASMVKGRVLWAFVPCEEKTPYACQRKAAPQGSFHCHNGHFVRQDLKCDGEDDCDDGSDELACNSSCAFHFTNQKSGTIMSPNFPSNYPDKQSCSWLIEVPVDYNVKLTFTEFNTESQLDEVVILAGGLTVSTSQQVARLSGNLTTRLPSYISSNNFLMVTFSSDGASNSKGFSATFSAVGEDSFPPRKLLTATDVSQELTSPYYPIYLGSQDYTWIISAQQKVKIVTLQIEEVDLRGNDRILIRDGDMVSSPLLMELTSSRDMPPYVLSTGRDLYITMQTRGIETGKGFKLSFWEGCSVNLTGISGQIHSPGYSSGQYGTYQTCTYSVSVPGGVPVSLRFDNFKLANNDRLLVYENNVAVQNLTGNSPPASFDITFGAFVIVFESDAILTDEGFSLTYSIACTDPLFNNQTTKLNPQPSGFNLGTQFDVSCVTGHAFSSQEFQDSQFKPLPKVQLECLAGGKWNVATLPLCEPLYCGPAPAVDKTYVMNSTGVTYGGTVSYLCYPGFAMTGQDTIRCSENGNWTQTPSCQPSSCTPLSDINDANKTILKMDGGNFSSIVKYTCNPGYQIVGDPLLFCGSDGNWSASVPSCEVLKCYVPADFSNGVLQRAGQMIEVGENVTVTCDPEYVSNAPSGGSITVICQPDRSLQGLDGFNCSYQDKCQADPNYCDQICHDSEFENRTCSCRDGYVLDSDLKSCLNVSECDTDNGGCDHTCTELPGGYLCSCDTGYALFTSNGTQGYYLAPSEDGMRAGDVRRLNHTCLPVRCPDPPVVTNGNLMVAQDSYHYGDNVEYTCQLGYELNGTSLLTCDQTGQWDNSPPHCSRSVCQPAVPTGSALNPATVTPSGPVYFGDTVTLTCDVPGRPVYNTSRYCIYYQGQYQLVGADYDCGLIDCGQPEVVSGSNYTDLNSNDTTYGASFTFACQNLYAVQGSSDTGNNSDTVRCLADGQWDFGSLRCAGVTCLDPGRPAGGRQVNTSSYDQGDLVYFECDEPGFTLSDPSPLICKLNAAGDGLEWNGTAPICIDTEPPVQTGCPAKMMSVDLYTSAKSVLALPTATDNVGVRTYTMVIPPNHRTWPSDDLLITKLEIFNFTATDFEGNTVSCDTMISVKDNVIPTIECPVEVLEEFTTEGETIPVNFSSSLFNVTGNDGPPAVTPTSLTFSATPAILETSFPRYRSFDVSATVKDASGNEASCMFQVHFKPRDCSPFTLREPLHGGKTCNATGLGFQCELFCDEGYVFYDQPTSSSLTYNCTNGNSWNVPEIPACVRANTASQQARFRQVFRYTYNKGDNTSCPDLSLYKVLLETNLTQSEAVLPNLCLRTVEAERITGNLTVSDVAEQGSDKILINITLNYDVRAPDVYEGCKDYIKQYFEDPDTVVNIPLKKEFILLACSKISYSDGGSLVESGYYCTGGRLIKYTPKGASSPIDVCVGCPEGMRKVNDNCELCPKGTFNPGLDSDTCFNCPSDTSTFRTGAVSSSECTKMCRAGLYSTTGLPPCRMCPKNTYSVNSTYCQPCPTDHVTRNTGATLSSSCLPPCPAGTYDPIDGHGLNCSKCPIHFYADKNGTDTCIECAGSETTRGEGSTSASDCIEISNCTVSNNPCQNAGSCSVSSHVVVCTCLEGYNGRFCEKPTDPCSSSPCYFGGTCIQNGTSYNCNCPTGTGGSRCEALVNSCSTNYCENGGACRNELNSKTCLCKPGFSGNTCQITNNICHPDPCDNGGTCLSMDNVRFRCQCPTGFEGKKCEINTDDCASKPCLYGGNCTDLTNDFQCSCPDGFSGKQCENRPQLCNSADCGGGTCVEDYRANTYRCVCPAGNYYGTVCQYEAQFGRDLNGSAELTFNATGVSIEECKEKCQGLSCMEFIYDNSTSTCWVASTTKPLSLQTGTSVYYKRDCMKVEETYWTPWYDSSKPSSDAAGSDDERVTTLNMYGLDICSGRGAVDAQCRVVGSKESPSETLAVNCTSSQGLLCNNNAQTDTQCENYEIRFKCLSSRVLSQSRCDGITYCSSGGVCQNNGNCSEAQTQALCSCGTGFSGSLCQHDKDDCVGKVCPNGGTCVDLPNNYRCDCLPGYTGMNCDDIDECFTTPCNTIGTQQCVNLVNRYECRCRPGFTGRHCETNIDECLSQPCLHGGICMDEVNGFGCNCTAGWTGPICDDLVQLCNNTTCDQGARCCNLFNDFYCSCFPNTYGKTCSNAPAICVNANPCLHGSACSESMGVAQCTCSPEFLGTGCHVRRDMCSTVDPACQNGATCSVSQGNFTCHCPEGYTGRFCEENIDDCQAATCPSTSTCIDMIGGYLCRCPVGKSGENCDKDTDTNFDLMFSSPDKNGMAALPYSLNMTDSGFTVTMWVQFFQKGETGTFFTLYSVSNPSSLSGKKELIRLDGEGATVSFQTQTERVLPSEEYNPNGKWHFIALTWNKSSRQFTFFVDTIRNIRTERTFDLRFVWMVLGCRYDVKTDLCLKDQGFKGYISQVTLYDLELDFLNNLTIVGYNNPFATFRGAVMKWGELLMYPGVTRVYPSQAKKACPPGFTGYSECTDIAPGKRTVSIDQNSCPADIIVHGTNRVTKVDWPEIRFTGQADLIKRSVAPGVLLLWGKYPVVVEASNNDGNKALCTFDIYVQYDTCTRPSTPANAMDVFCADYPETGRSKYRQCNVQCPSQYRIVVPSPRIDTCGPVGSWDPPNLYLPFTMSPCGDTSTPKRRLKVVIIYHVPSTNCDGVKNVLLELISQRLQGQNLQWSNGLCKLSDCSDIQLDIVCTLRQTVINADIETTITADDVPVSLTSTSDPGVTRSPEDLLQQLILSDNFFNFENTIALAAPDPNGLTVEVQLLCQAPLALRGSQCVECAPGTYYNASTMTCAFCPIGSYQPQSNQSDCIPCNSGTITETVGSTDDTQCKEICPAGQYFHKAMNNCTLCAQGFYQNVSGRFYCLPCPVDKTTRQEGANSEAVCFNDCPPGKGLSENGTCTPCAIGFYKPIGPTVCQPCPTGLVTNETGADSEDDCNVADNLPGFYRLRNNETQSAPCPIGTYQPEKWKYDCLTCGGDRFRTDNTGTIYKSDCKYFCPAGQQQVGSEEQCEPCTIGYFRTGSDPYSKCEICPNNTRTSGTGATSTANCTIYKCPAGQKPKDDQTDCQKCPRGTYQPLADQTDCIPCAGNQTDTRTDGAVQASQCEDYCDSGYEKADNGTCVICPLGTFKNNSIDTFHNCTSCLDPAYVTSGPGATSDSECTVLNCQAGYKINGNVCEACPQGTYQFQPYQSDCISCPAHKSTRQNTSKSINDCEVYCDPGSEKNSNGQCDLCQRGYYKNNLDDVFMECTLCPSDFVTLTNGSTSQDNCTVRNCTEGYYIDGNNLCQQCDFGQYQPMPWQSSCLQCDTDKNTTRKGAVSENECSLSCPPGKDYHAVSDACTECQQGTYKDTEGRTSCIACPTGNVTRTNGSTSVSDCNLRACDPGNYADSSAGGQCTACDYGQYQPSKWQEQCLPCPSGKTSYQRGADSEDLCLLDCAAGEEYSSTTKSCEPCPVGYYNDDTDRARYTCAVCPTSFITNGTGSTSSNDCTVRNCTQAGQYREISDNSCRDCPRGEWQDQKWQTSCIRCDPDDTTRDVGSSQASDCLRDCPSGQQLNQTSGACEPCLVGSFRNKSESWVCQPCPVDLTTQSTGAASVQECSKPTCAKGYFYSTQDQNCVVCQQNSYQDQTGQFQCKPCADGFETRDPGATSVSQCLDNCQIYASTCDVSATCTRVTGGVTCVCRDGYRGNGTTCTHVCDVAGYCQNSDGCDRVLFKCICKVNYEGPTCEQRKGPQMLVEKDIIIISTVTTIVFILIVILITICCVLNFKKRRQNKVPLHNDMSDERASIATRMSTRGYDDYGGIFGSKAPSVAATPRLVIPAHAQQMYENPTYILDDEDPAVYKT